MKYIIVANMYWISMDGVLGWNGLLGAQILLNWEREPFQPMDIGKCGYMKRSIYGGENE